jgi:hypothetical protein
VVIEYWSYASDDKLKGIKERTPQLPAVTSEHQAYVLEENDAKLEQVIEGIYELKVKEEMFL